MDIENIRFILGIMLKYSKLKYSFILITKLELKYWIEEFAKDITESEVI